MKKLTLFLTTAVLVAAVLAGIMPAAAQSQPDLHALAAYFPEGTAIYAAVRTDDAFIDELDALLASVIGKLPPGAVPPVSLREELDRSISDSFGRNATFENTIRTWMGDSGAVGVVSIDVLLDNDFNNDEDVPFMIAVEVTDMDAAEAYLDSVSDDAQLTEKEETEDGILYSPSEDSFSSGAILLMEDVVLVAPSSMVLLEQSSPRGGTLADSQVFQTTVGMLPESGNYGAEVYLDIGDMLVQTYTQMMAMMDSFGNMGADEMAMRAMIEPMLPLYENYPQMAMGFTVLDGRSFTMDLAQTGYDEAVFEEILGMDVELYTDPVDLSFMERIPGDAPVVIAGTNLGNSTRQSLDAMVYVFDMMWTQWMLMAEMGGMSGMGGMDDMPRFVRDISGKDIKTFISLAFAGMTGLNLENDVLAHINGTSVLYGRIIPAEGIDITYDTALVIENTDAAAFDNIFSKLVSALEQYDSVFELEGDGSMVSLPRVIRGFFPESFTDEQLAAPELDFMFGLTDEAFALGSRAGVEYSLAPSGDSLADNAAFIDAESYFLPDTMLVWYLGVEPIDELLTQIIELMPRSQARDLMQARTVLRLFSSASITAQYNEDWSGVARFVITLAE